MSRLTIWMGPQTATLQNLVNAASSGAYLDLRGYTPFATGATINKPLTLRGGTINVPAATTALTIAAGTANVTLDGVKVAGAQSHNYVAAEQALLVNGTAVSPVTNLTVRNCNFGTLGGAGIWANYCSNFLFDRNTITDVFYAGAMIISGATGAISNNSVARIGQGWATGGSGGGLDANNCYGIALSDSGGPASSHVLVSGNTVVDVPTWHAFDTHSGQYIDFTNNSLLRCSRGIWFASVNHTASYCTATYNSVGSPSPVNFNLGAVTTFATDHVTIQYNTINGWAGNNIQDVGGPASTNLVTTPNTIT